MRILFAFSGGCLDNSLLLADPTHWTAEREMAEAYYRASKHGCPGCRFLVPHGDTMDCYEIARRREVNNTILLRATHVNHGAGVEEPLVNR